jgi:hypothetical protein
MTWNPGDTLALRGMYNGHPWYVQSAIVVQDTPAEVAMLILPGAECAAPAGYIHQKHGPEGRWERWQEMLNPPWTLEKYTWQTNRFLILLKPGEFFATIYIWQQATDLFQCYYINFQLPYRRSPYGFDTFDLELDLVIGPDYGWQWKDAEDYQRGIEAGILIPEWTQGIETAKKDVFAKLAQRHYPLNGRWLDWKPDPAWAAPQLPAGWETPADYAQ